MQAYIVIEVAYSALTTRTDKIARLSFILRKCKTIQVIGCHNRAPLEYSDLNHSMSKCIVSSACLMRVIHSSAF